MIHHNPEAAINNFHEKNLRSIANIIILLNTKFSVSLCHGQLDLLNKVLYFCTLNIRTN